MSKPINYARYTLSEIDPEARRIATAWVDGFEKIGSLNIEQKAKLASDIMNYAKAQLEAAQEEIEKLKGQNKIKDSLIESRDIIIGYRDAELSRVKVENERKEEMINNFEEQILERNICNCRYDKEGDCDRFRKYKRLIQVGLPIIEEFAKHTTGIFKQKAEQALAEYQTLNEPKR